MYVVDLPHTRLPIFMDRIEVGFEDGRRIEVAIFFDDVYQKPFISYTYIYKHVGGIRRAYRSFCKNRTLLFTT